MTTITTLTLAQIDAQIEEARAYMAAGKITRKMGTDAIFRLRRERQILVLALAAAK